MKKFFLFSFILLAFLSPSIVSAEEQKIGLTYLNNSQVIISNDMGADVQLARNTTNQNQMDIKTIIFTSNYNFKKNVLYEYEIETNNSYITNNTNKISLKGYNMSCNLISIQGYNTNYLQVRFTCPNDTSYILLSLSNLSGQNITTGYQIGWNSIYLWQITDTIDVSPIINNDNQNTQNIINNNNQNTQDIINSNQVCYNVDKYNVENSGYFLNENGEEVSNGGYGITSYFKINSTSKINVIFNRNDSAALCFYNVNKSLISCTKDNQFTLGQQVTIPSNADYFRATINLGDNKPTYQICSNGNQAVSDKLDEQEKTSKGILGKLRDLFDTLFSDDDADVSGLNNMVGWLPPGPVDSIINLPLAFFNALTNTLTGTCQSVSIPIPFVNQTLILPCFDAYMSQYLTGFSTLWTLVGTILSVFILYYYLLALYKWVDDTLTFRENNLPGYYGDNWGGGA